MLQALQGISYPRAAKSLLLVLTLFYLGFHALSGERGVVALFKESHKLEALKATLAETKAKREELEKKTTLLANNSLDLDLLDEESRKVLGLAAGNEIVILQKRLQKP